MEWKVVSLLMEAPVIPEPAVKGTGILGTYMECYRRNSSSEKNWGLVEAGLGAIVCFLMTESRYAFLWFSFMCLHKAFFMLSCYVVVASPQYLGRQTKKNLCLHVVYLVERQVSTIPHRKMSQHLPQKSCNKRLPSEPVHFQALLPPDQVCRLPTHLGPPAASEVGGITGQGSSSIYSLVNISFLLPFLVYSQGFLRKGDTQ